MNILQRALKELDNRNIKYLSFKGNTGLHKVFSGKGDLDVLVDKSRAGEACSVFFAGGGKRVRASLGTDYPGTDNFLFFDEESGEILHLHLYFCLILGKSYVAEYVLPLEDLLMETRVWDEEFSLYKSEPAAELLLLVIRSAIEGKCDAEKYEALRLSADKENLQGYAAKVFGEETAEEIRQICEKGDRPSGQGALMKRIRYHFKDCRRMSVPGAFFRSIWIFIRRRLDKRIFTARGTKVVKKAPQTGGAIIAFVGIDGAGKSSVIKDVRKWISDKAELKTWYMGTGDGKTTAYVSALKNAGKAVRGGKKGKRERDRERIFFFRSPVKYIKKILKLSLIGDVQRNNRRKLLIMNRFRMNGGISICDRFPQIETVGQNDGLKAVVYRDVLGDNLITRHFIRKEENCLSIVKKVKPDLVIRLTVEPREGLMRKGDEINKANIAAHKKKMEELMSVEYQGARIVNIDTSMPYEEELLMIKRLLWEFI